MARRRFNRFQPRDRFGRWTRGVGSSRRRSGSKFKSGRRILTASEQRKKSQTLSTFRKTTNGALAGAATGFFIAGGYGAVAGAVIGGTGGARTRRKKGR